MQNPNAQAPQIQNQTQTQNQTMNPGQVAGATQAGVAPAGLPAAATAGSFAAGRPATSAALDFTDGQYATVSDGAGGGSKLTDGDYVFVLLDVEHSISENPDTAGAKKTVLKGLVVRQLSAESTAPVGASRDIVKLSANPTGYYSTLLGLIACLKDDGSTASSLKEGGQFAGYMGTLVTDPTSVKGSAVVVKVRTKTSKKGNLFTIYDFDRIVPEDELFEILSQPGNESLADLALIDGKFRSQHGLQPSAAYFA